MDRPGCRSYESALWLYKPPQARRCIVYVLPSDPYGCRLWTEEGLLQTSICLNQYKPIDPQLSVHYRSIWLHNLHSSPLLLPQMAKSSLEGRTEKVVIETKEFTLGTSSRQKEDNSDCMKVLQLLVFISCYGRWFLYSSLSHLFHIFVYWISPVDAWILQSTMWGFVNDANVACSCQVLFLQNLEGLINLPKWTYIVNERIHLIFS